MRCARRNDHHPSPVEHVLFAGHSASHSTLDDFQPFLLVRVDVIARGCRDFASDVLASEEFARRLLGRLKNDHSIKPCGTIGNCCPHHLSPSTKKTAASDDDFNIPTVMNGCATADIGVSAESG